MAKPDLRAVPSELPEPPYPADTRAKGMAFDIDLERMEQSRTWLLATPEIRPWLLRLWIESWKSIPCGSFEDDEELIAARIQMPINQFSANKETLLRGWKLHNDGRLYHGFITDLVLKLVHWRSDERERKRAWRAKMSRGTDVGQTRDSVGRTACPDTSSSSSSPSNISNSGSNTDIGKGGLGEREEQPTQAGRSRGHRVFVRPKVDDVKAYCRERGNNVDAEAFVAFYESNGWKVGRNGMKDWKAAVRTWEKRNAENQRNSGGKESAVERRRRINAEIEARARRHFPEMG